MLPVDNRAANYLSYQRDKVLSKAVFDSVARFHPPRNGPYEAGWQSGHAADCKSVNAGSIPTSASIIQQ